MLSELVSGLVRASAPNATSFRFPTGDSAQITGYDGTLEATEMPPYVPGGVSVWEFGTSEDYAKQAQENYVKRTEHPGSVFRAETTFVFVTARTWPSDKIAQWIESKKKEGSWKDVRVLDAVALEDWLERNPACGVRIARELLKTVPPNGVRSVDDFWIEYSSRFEPAITEDVILAGRTEQGKLLVQQLQGPQGSYLWQADSLDEVVAFAVACIHKSDEASRRFLESRTVIVETEEALKEIAHREDLILIARATALNLPGFLGKRNPTIVPVGNDQINRKSSTLLPRPRFDELSQALKTMGLEEDQAQSLARKCGRSVTILARRIPSSVAKKPEWSGHRELVPALLAGGWSTNSDEDKNAICTLAGCPTYGAYEKEMLPFLTMTEDAPLEREKDVWRVRAPVDLFVQFGSLISADDLERFARVAQLVFGEQNPALDLEPNERFYAGIRGKTLKYSEWLRTGLATTLVLIANFHEDAGLHIAGANPEEFVNRIVAQIPGLDADYRAIANLYGVLHLIAEAAPHPLLQALEQMLEGDENRIMPIFQDKEDYLFSSSPHTELLWSLEVLAWSPELLSDVALKLAKLARIDPGGKLVNRPLNSLREIFLPWHPSTNANLEQRLSALDYLTKHEPAIAWKLLIELLPSSHSTASPTAKPRFREWGASNRENTTYGSLARVYGDIINRVIVLAGKDSNRWVTLIRSFGSFSPEDRARATDQLEILAASIQEEEQEKIWTALRDEVYRHKRFQDAPWAMAESDLVRLDALVEKLKPNDISTQVAWLFDEYHPHMPGVADITEETRLINKARNEGIRQLYKDGNVQAIVDFARTVKLPFYVGYAAVEVVDSITELTEAIGFALPLSTYGIEQFASALSSAARRKHKDQWGQIIETKFRARHWSVKEVVILMSNWDDTHETWDFVSALGPEVEELYWSSKKSRPMQVDKQDFQFVADKYLQYGSAIAAIDSLAYSAAAASPDTLFRLLDTAIPELNSDPQRGSTNWVYDIQQIFAELQKRDGVPPLEIARREYAYLPLLEYHRQPLTIHTLLAKDPEFFVQIICDIFKPASGEPREPTEDRKARARSGYRLLSEFHVVPGSTNGSINKTELKEWIDTARTLAAEKDRAAIADEYIGHLLAHAPSDEKDTAWPHREVRDVIEELASPKVELGIQIERFNMRGVTTRGPYDGGDQERSLAIEVRRWSKVCSSWPRTAKLLEEIAKNWERHAEQEDSRARQDEMRFEG